MLFAETAQDSMDLRDSEHARFASVVGAGVTLLSRGVVEIKRNTRAVVQKAA